MFQCPRAFFFTALIAAMGFLALAPSGQAQAVYGIPVTVNNPTDIARVDEPVATGTAVPRMANTLNPDDDFRLVDHTGQPVPVEFKVLSRWDGKREDGGKLAKWVLIKFLANVAPQSSSTYYVQYGPKMPGQITVDNQATEITINTGAAEFKLDKQTFSVLKSAKIGATTVTSAPGRLDIRDTNGNLLDVYLTSTEIEENGSVRTVVCQRGGITGLGLEYTIRFFFWSGRKDVKVDFRLENNGMYGELTGTGSLPQHAWFQDLDIVVNVNDETADVVTSEMDIDSSGADYKLRQTFNTPSNAYDQLSGFSYLQELSGTDMTPGNRYSGALAINGSNGSALVAVDRFWQNFPKSLGASGDELSVGLWPTFGNGPHYVGQWGNNSSPNLDTVADTHYRFEGGRWKTYTLTLDFRLAGTYSPQDVADAATRLEKPLMALLPLEWPFRFFAFGHPLVERRDWNDTARNRFEQIVQVLADDDAADNHPTNGKIGLPEFRNRGGTYGGGQFYGWTNFGDIMWADGYCSNHYDLPWSVLINFYRTGDYKFYDVGRDLIAHRRDYDQNHSQDPSANRRGGQFYEKGWTHGNYQAPTPSHTWVNGLLLWYVMTGDEGARESAIEVGDFLIRQNPGGWDGRWGSRILGWEVEGLVNLYNYLGDPIYLQTAQAGIQNWEALEQSFGGQGYVLNTGWSTPQCQSWMHAIVYSAIGKYYLTTFDSSVLPIMDRMAIWFMQNMVMEMPTGPWGARSTGKIWEFYDGTNVSGPSVHHQWAVVDAMGYAAICLHNLNYYQVSESLFESVTRYFQQSAGNASLKNYFDAGDFSPISFKPAQFPGSETKVMSNMALWGQSHLAFEALWEGYF